jgi:hypothetical protein
MPKLGHDLAAIVEQTQHLKQVYKTNLQFGDWVIVTTLNSVYSIRVIESDLYLVSGGWFDRHGISPLKTRINGCTWGGSIIKLDIVAACGLCLEFGNRVVTSTIRKIVVVPSGGQN